jgi:3-dehydroquinate synthase
MPAVDVALGERSYTIQIQPGLLERSGDTLAAVCRSPRVAVVAQRRVWDRWGAPLEISLQQAGLAHSVHLVPNGEGAKRIAWLQRLYAAFAAAGVDRQSTVAAFGGGAVGDLAGFAAATWLRGVDFVQIPTTLLAQVDASVGGKVGVNLPSGKNLAGAFWQPRAVLIDPQTLRTLPRRELLSGLAEVIKYGIILDADFFEWVNENRTALLSLESEALTQAIRRSCELKAFVVQSDERESGLRAILNYGHTIGHLIEREAGYAGIRHGEAVAIGMVLAARLAVRLGMLESVAAERIRQTIHSFGLPVSVPQNMTADRMVSGLSLDKKARGGRARFVLPERIGRVVVTDAVTPEMVREVIVESQKESAGRS